MRKIIIAALILMAVCINAARTEETSEFPSVTLPVTDTAPVLDGVFDDACWKTAAAIEKFHVFKEPGKTEPQKAWLTRDKEWIYLAFEITHPHPKFIKQTVFEQDGAVQQDDSLEIFIDPGTGGNIYLHYLLNAANIKADQLAGKDGRRDRAYPMPWRSATLLTATGWNAEIAIPLSALKRCRQMTTAIDLAKTRINLTITAAIPAFDPYGAIMCTTMRYFTWAPVIASPHEPDRFGALKGLPAFDEIQTTVPGQFLAPHLFLPRLAGVQVGAFELKDGQPGYSLSAVVSNSTGATGAVNVLVADRPVTGVATSVLQCASLAGDQAQTVAVRVTMATPGRRTAVVWLEDAARGGAFSSQLLDEQALIAMEPFTATPDRNYYTTEQSARIVCRVRLPAETIPQCRIAVKNRNGRVMAETRKVAGETQLPIPLESIPMGRTDLRVELQDANEKCLAVQDAFLVKQPPNPGCEIKVDQVNRVLLRNGVPFFCFGMTVFTFQEDVLKRLADAGFNTMSLFRTGNIDVNQLKDNLDQAHKHGLMVWDIIQGIDIVPYPVGHPIWVEAEKKGGRNGAEKSLTVPEEVERATLQFNERSAGLEPAAKVLTSHPGFLAHMPGHEPNIVNLEARRTAAELHAKRLAELDPYHPSLVVYAGADIPSGERWTSWVEILSFDIYTYPGWGRPESQPGQMAAYARRLKARADAAGKVMFIIPMAEALNPARCPRGLRPEEQRCQTYLALIHGAKGLSYFALDSLKSKTAWDTLSRLAMEMKTLGPAVVAPVPEQIITYDPGVFGPDKNKFPDVHAALFRHPDGRYILLAANSQPCPVDTTFTVPGLSSEKTVKMLFMTNDLPVKDSAFSERLEGYGTRAYEIRDLPSVATSGARAKEGQRSEVRDQKEKESTAYSLQPTAAIEIAVTMKAQKELYAPEPPFNPGAVSKRKNVMPNPSLEQMGVPGLPDYISSSRTCPYKALAGEPGALWGVDTNSPFHGRYCAWVDSRRDCDPHDYCRDPAIDGVCYLPALTRPTPYVFSLYMRGAKAGDKVNVTMSGMKTQAFTLTPEWQRYSLKGVMASGGTMEFRVAPARGSMVWMDALQMEAGEEPTPFSED